MTIVSYPARGSLAWDTTLKAYIDQAAGGVVVDAPTSASIQAAIDAADVLESADVNNPTIFLPPSVYSMTTTLNWKAGNLVAPWPGSSVQFVWNGTAGGTMLSRPLNASADNSFFLMQGIEWSHGTTDPATMLDLTPVAQPVDKFGIIRDCMFAGCSGDAIKLPGFVNLHWTDLRFDGPGGYAVRTTPGASQNHSSFLIDRFTYSSMTGGAGVICIDNSASAPNLGIVALADGRIEINTAAWSSNKAVFNLILPNTTPPSGSVVPILERVNIAAEAGLSGNRILYRQCTSATTTEKLVLRDVGFNDPANWTTIGGNALSTSQLVPATLEYTDCEVHTDGVLAHLATLLGGASGVSYPLNVARSGEAQPRLRVDNSGSLQWGDGTAFDLLLSRNGADLLQIDDGDGLEFGEKGSDFAAPSANRVRLYCKDNGSGKTQLVARFSSGAVQVLATQP